MRENFVRRVAGFLMVLLLGVLFLSEHGPFRMTLAQAVEARFQGPDVEEAISAKRMLTAPVLDAEDVARLMRGEFSGVYSVGDATGE